MRIIKDETFMKKAAEFLVAGGKAFEYLDKTPDLGGYEFKGEISDAIELFFGRHLTDDEVIYLVDNGTENIVIAFSREGSKFLGDIANA